MNIKCRYIKDCKVLLTWQRHKIDGAVDYKCDLHFTSLCLSIADSCQSGRIPLEKVLFDFAQNVTGKPSMHLFSLVRCPCLESVPLPVAPELCSISFGQNWLWRATLLHVMEPMKRWIQCNFADCKAFVQGHFYLHSIPLLSSPSLFAFVDTMALPQSNKLRILCLHGWMQNSEVMTRNMAALINRFKDSIEFGNLILYVLALQNHRCIMSHHSLVIPTGTFELPSSVKPGRPSKQKGGIYLFFFLSFGRLKIRSHTSCV